MSRIQTVLLGFTILATQVGHAAGKGPRVLKEGKRPEDRRLQPMRDLNGYFPFRVPETRREWERRSNQVRHRMRVSLGLFPLPSRTPLNAIVFNRRDFAGYSIEKVHFAAMPGFFVTGNLYRPLGKTGPFPAVLCPHGHWRNGRFMDAGEKAAKDQIAQGAEKFMAAARSPLQARCVQLARLGCVVFHYDMIGYADSIQISHQVAHGFAKQRPDMNHEYVWGLFSPQAESHLQSVMGLQTFSSIRALDFVSALSDVDKKRLAVTGASGGGTQTFVLAAIDPRPALAFPAVMVSTAMQGGCTCENASLFRVGAGNVEFAGLFAPKPMGLTAANDWTKEMAGKGFPELKKLYKLLGAGDNVSLTSRIEFGHNYNLISRTAMYTLINKHFKLGHQTPIVERDFEFQTAKQLSVWEGSRRPKGGPALERRLLAHWTQQTRSQIPFKIRNRAQFRSYRMIVGNGLDAVIGRNLPGQGDVVFEQMHKQERDEHLEIGGVLRYEKQKEELPAVFLYPKEWNKRVVVWLTKEGKAGLFDANGNLDSAVMKLVQDGNTVVGIDLFQQGEFLTPQKTSGDESQAALVKNGQLVRTRRVKNTRQAAAYSFGYNHTVAARRTHDVLSVVAYLRDHEYTPELISVVALDDTAPLAVAARAQARGAIHRLAIDTKGFRFGRVTSLRSPHFLPGGAKYDDLGGMLAVAAPAEVWIAGEGDLLPPIVGRAYRAEKGDKRLTVYRGDQAAAKLAAVKWLLRAPNGKAAE